MKYNLSQFNQGISRTGMQADLQALFMKGLISLAQTDDGQQTDCRQCGQRRRSRPFQILNTNTAAFDAFSFIFSMPGVTRLHVQIFSHSFTRASVQYKTQGKTAKS